MYSRNHAILSALIGVPIAIGFPETQRPVLLWSFLVIIGVGIDLDHFLIGRLNRGNWTNLRRCLRTPSRVFVNQESIFDRGDIWRDQRLLSHLLIGGILVGVLWPVNRYWSFGTAVILYTHVISDLYSDIQRRDQYLSESSE